MIVNISEDERYPFYKIIDIDAHGDYRVDLNPGDIAFIRHAMALFELAQAKISDAVDALE